jgi:hypothetical protein
VHLSLGFSFHMGLAALAFSIESPAPGVGDFLPQFVEPF